MIAFAYYLLKVVTCSGILYGYYHLALKDKVFHQWNRFYLLGSVLLAMVLPLVQVEVNTPVQPESKVITVLQMVSGADEYVREVNAKPMSFLNGEFLSAAAYLMISMVTLILFLLALRRIHQMIRKHEVITIDDFYFLNTIEPGTPFSYFRFLLWNREIPLNTENGQRILEHELVHIREKHSWDKVFMQLSLVVYWINPFFWLIRKELSLVHEFIADQKTVGSGDAQAFARLLLETSFPGYAPMMTNSFFTSSIKRRLAMMNKKQHPGLNYLSRLMMIPVLFMLLFAFSVKAKTLLKENPKQLPLDKPVTVVIDAGHGGTDAGVQNGESDEKTLTLSLAKWIKELNKNPKINIVLARDQDELQPLANKVSVAKNVKADIYVSIHINGSNDLTKSGIEAYVSKKEDNSFMAENRRLATLMLKNLQIVYTTDASIKQRDRGIFVLDKNVCPAVIVEMGYLTNNNDLQFISNRNNQEKLARQVLKSIEEYFDPSVQVVSVTSNNPDTTIKPKIELIKYEGQTSAKPGQVKQDDMTISSDTIFIKGPVSMSLKKSLPMDVRYTIDGKPSYPAAFERLRPEDIHSISVNKGKTSTDKGSIDVITKQGLAANPSLGRTFQGKSTTSVSTFNATSINPKDTTSTGNKVFSGVVTTTSFEAKPVTISLTGVASTTNEVPRGVKIKREPDSPLPLFVVNGEEKSQEEINQMNPENIASIRVLKGDDAEKSYGAKGKNGVILITTKK